MEGMHNCYLDLFAPPSAFLTDVGLLLGTRVQEQLGKEVRPALDTALGMAGGNGWHGLCGIFFRLHNFCESFCNVAGIQRPAQCVMCLSSGHFLEWQPSELQAEYLCKPRRLPKLFVC